MKSPASDEELLVTSENWASTLHYSSRKVRHHQNVMFRVIIPASFCFSVIPCVLPQMPYYSHPILKARSRRLASQVFVTAITSAYKTAVNNLILNLSVFSRMNLPRALLAAPTGFLFWLASKITQGIFFFDLQRVLLFLFSTILTSFADNAFPKKTASVAWRRLILHLDEISYFRLLS